MPKDKNSHPTINIDQIQDNKIKDAISQTEKEIALEDLKNDHQVRKAWKKCLEQFFNHLPFFAKSMLWLIIGMPSIAIVVNYIYLILGNEDKLEKVITSSIWTFLTSLAVVGLPHVKDIFKK